MIRWQSRLIWCELCIFMSSMTDAYGVLSINGKVPTPGELSRLLDIPQKELARAFEDFDRAGVWAKNESGYPYSERMVADHERRSVMRQRGALGGNPALVTKDKPEVKPQDNHKDKPSLNQDLNPEVNQATHPEVNHELNQPLARVRGAAGPRAPRPDRGPAGLNPTLPYPSRENPPQTPPLNRSTRSRPKGGQTDLSIVQVGGGNTAGMDAGHQAARPIPVTVKPMNGAGHHGQTQPLDGIVASPQAAQALARFTALARKQGLAPADLDPAVIGEWITALKPHTKRAIDVAIRNDQLQPSQMRAWLVDGKAAWRRANGMPTPDAAPGPTASHAGEGEGLTGQGRGE